MGICLLFVLLGEIGQAGGLSSASDPCGIYDWKEVKLGGLGLWRVRVASVPGRRGTPPPQGPPPQGPPGEGTIRHGGDGLIERLRSTGTPELRPDPKDPADTLLAFLVEQDIPITDRLGYTKGPFPTNVHYFVLGTGHVGTFPSVPPSYWGAKPVS